jgi:hypothetical protein
VVRQALPPPHHDTAGEEARSEGDEYGDAGTGRGRPDWPVGVTAESNPSACHGWFRLCPFQSRFENTRYVTRAKRGNLTYQIFSKV